MKVYLIGNEGSRSNTYTVVAESYAEAEKLWKEKYKSIPASMRIFSDYVIWDDVQRTN